MVDLNQRVNMVMPQPSSREIPELYSHCAINKKLWGFVSHHILA